MSLAICLVALAACALPPLQLIGCENGRPALVCSKNFDRVHSSVEILPAAGFESGSCDQGVSGVYFGQIDSGLEFRWLFDLSSLVRLAAFASVVLP
jgi:hypothetical protein